MRSPSIYTDCSRVWPGYNIADVHRTLYLENWYGSGFVYAYTSVKFNGWQRNNFTALSDIWLNSTKTAILASCAANATCVTAYNAYPNDANAVLTQYINAAILDLSLDLPADGHLTWNPGTSYANALST